MATRGRPKLKLSAEQLARVESMAVAQCRDLTIARSLGIAEETFRRNFGELCAQKRAAGKAALLQAQYSAAISGNPTMLIWCGKQHLQQSDRQDLTSGGERMPTLFAAIAAMRNQEKS